MFKTAVVVLRTVIIMNTFFPESTQITESHNHTAVEFINQNQTQCQIIIIISGLMNGLLLIVLIGE